MHEISPLISLLDPHKIAMITAKKGGNEKMIYPSYPQSYPQTYPRQEVIRVNGKGGAEAFVMSPNSSVLLLDENSPIIWLKTTDGAGYPSLTPYTITPYKEEPQPDYKSLDERIKKLEEALNESNHSKSGKSKSVAD